MVYLWRGFHHRELPELLQNSWEKNQLTILVPVSLRDFSFLQLFKKEDVILHGDWPAEIQSLFLFSKDEKSANEILKKAILGVFTSGTSTGMPRLVFYSKENIEVSLSSIRELFEKEKIKKIFVYPQPTHTFGLILGYLHSLLGSAKPVFFEGAYSRKAHELWLAEVDESTVTLGTPTHFMDLIQYLKSTGQTPNSSYSAIVGGARVTRKLWLELRDLLKIQKPSIGYGATEASPGVTHLAPGVEPVEDGDIGSLLKGVEFTNQGDAGIQISGKNICLGVFERGELTSPKTVVLHDFLEMGKEGRLTFVGRTDYLVNRGGLKVSLEIIESKLASSLKCKCLAFPFFSERLGEDIGVLVSLPEDQNREQFLRDARLMLANEVSVQLPEGNFCFAEIPLNANGKFDRKEALRIYLQSKKWEFPIDMRNLQSFLPHRGKAVWVDSILEVSKNYGLVEVVIKENASYFSGEYVRPSTAIEWVAQAYGYTRAMNGILGLQMVEQANKTFIAEVKSCDFLATKDDWKLKPGSPIRVEVKCTHDFGVLKVVNGKVFKDDKVFANLNVKLYSSQ